VRFTMPASAGPTFWWDPPSGVTTGASVFVSGLSTPYNRKRPSRDELVAYLYPASDFSKSRSSPAPFASLR
jgi:hypothetical protein